MIRVCVCVYLCFVRRLSLLVSNDGILFRSRTTGYCSRTKGLFSQENLSKDVQIHELDRMPNGSSVQQALAEMTGQRTVPNVFVKGQHLGGNDDTQSAFRSGKLKSMLL